MNIVTLYPSTKNIEEHGIIRIDCDRPELITTMAEIAFPLNPRCACGEEFQNIDEFIAHYLKNRPVKNTVGESQLPPEIEMHVAKHNLVNMVAERVRHRKQLAGVS